MACSELFMMALLAALKKNNMTSEPIVMWLGNSSSPARLVPWSFVSKPRPSKHHFGTELVEPEIVHFYPGHRKITAPRSQSAKPPFEKHRQTPKWRKGGRGPWKQKEKGEWKRGKSHRKKWPPPTTARKRGDEKGTSREPKRATVHEARSTPTGAAEEGGGAPETQARQQKSTTRKHQRHRQHGEGRHADTEEPGGAHHRKKSGKHTTTSSFIWTSFKELSSMFSPSDRAEEAGHTAKSESQETLTRKQHKPGHHKHRKGHSTSATHKTAGGGPRGHPTHGKSKSMAEKREDATSKHKRPHGRPSSSSHQHKTTVTEPVSSASPGVTEKDHNGRKSTEKENLDQPGSTSELSLGLEDESVESHASGGFHGGLSKGPTKSPPKFEATIDLTTGEAKQERKAPWSSQPPKSSGHLSSASSGGNPHTNALRTSTNSGTQRDNKSSRDAERHSLEAKKAADEAEGATHKAPKTRHRLHRKHRHRRNRNARRLSWGMAHPKDGPQRSMFRAADEDEQPSKKLPSMLQTIPVKGPEE